MTGKVLYRGKPLAFGSVMFRLKDKDGAKISRGTIQPDGTFQMGAQRAGDGVDVGLNLVRITCYEIQKPNGRPDAKFGAFGRLFIPKKYTEFDTSGLTVNVPLDANKPLVFELVDE